MGKWILVSVAAMTLGAYSIRAEPTVCGEISRTLGDNIEANASWNTYCAEQTDHDREAGEKG